MARLQKQTWFTLGFVLLILAVLVVFFRTLPQSQDQENPYEAPPGAKKNVVLQSEELKDRALADLASKGEVVTGMTAAQVREAWGLPARMDVEQEGNRRVPVWFYGQDGQRRVVFGVDSVVTRVDVGAQK